jgi:hypothetical protein
MIFKLIKILFQVYPYWTYSYLVLSIPAMLLTDLLLYKPVLLVASLAYISVWLTLIFGCKKINLKSRKNKIIKKINNFNKIK